MNLQSSGFFKPHTISHLPAGLASVLCAELVAMFTISVLLSIIEAVQTWQPC